MTPNTPASTPLLMHCCDRMSVELDAGPNGYDEVNQAKRAGNFGWPMFVGPNEAYRRWDFAAGVGGAWFDLERRINDSKNNTGSRVLPPAEPSEEYNRSLVAWYCWRVLDTTL